MITQNKRLVVILLSILLMLLVPFIAMQFTSEVNWSPMDFVAAAVLLFVTEFTCELILRKVKKTSQRLALCGATLLVLLLIWAELAVGIFGTPFAGS